MGAALAKFRGCEYMPFRLKETLVRHGIAKATICEATLQTGGRPMSRTAMSTTQSRLTSLASVARSCAW